jgi:hypothetical protein
LSYLFKTIFPLYYYYFFPLICAFWWFDDQVQQAIHDAGFFVDVDDSSRTLNKKVREAQVGQYNFIIVVGQQEIESKVNVRIMVV